MSRRDDEDETTGVHGDVDTSTFQNDPTTHQPSSSSPATSSTSAGLDSSHAPPNPPPGVATSRGIGAPTYPVPGEQYQAMGQVGPSGGQLSPGGGQLGPGGGQLGPGGGQLGPGGGQLGPGGGQLGPGGGQLGPGGGQLGPGGGQFGPGGGQLGPGGGQLGPGGGQLSSGSSGGIAPSGASPSSSSGTPPAGTAPVGAPPGSPSGGGGAPPSEPKTGVGKAVIVGFRDAGAPVVRFLDAVGGHLILVGKALAWLPRRPFRLKNYLEAAEYIGFGSLPIVLLVGAFTGMVLSLQSVAAFGQLGFESFSGAATGKALSIELAPVLTSLMLAGRAGSGIATELGTMRISEQIDALESMAVNPIQFLVLPRLIAAMIVTPILTLLFFVIGMGGAYFVAIILKGVDQGQWVAQLRDLVTPTDVLQGIIKSVVFGFLVALIGCYQGYNASGGGRGVGIGTTRAVVVASVATLCLDYFLTDILLSVFGTQID